MAEVRETFIQGPPGIRYEATWGRKRSKAATFIGRVYEQVDGGGMQLWACDHKHATRAEAHACAETEATAMARV